MTGPGGTVNEAIPDYALYVIQDLYLFNRYSRGDFTTSLSQGCREHLKGNVPSAVLSQSTPSARLPKRGRSAKQRLVRDGATSLDDWSPTVRGRLRNCNELKPVREGIYAQIRGRANPDFRVARQTLPTAKQANKEITPCANFI